MITLRNFTKEDATALHQTCYSDMSLGQIENLINKWSTKQVGSKYFEMFAVLCDGNIVGMISLYQHTTHVISIGPEIFRDYRRKGFAKEAITRAFEIAKEKGYKIVSQQIRTNNQASIALHTSIGFETSGAVYTNAKGHQVSIYLKYLI